MARYRAEIGGTEVEAFAGAARCANEPWHLNVVFEVNPDAESETNDREFVATVVTPHWWGPKENEQFGGEFLETLGFTKLED